MSSTEIPEFVGFDQYFISLERFENEQIYMQNANTMQNMQNEQHAASRHRLQRAQRTPTIVGQAANEKLGHFIGCWEATERISGQSEGFTLGKQPK